MTTYRLGTVAWFNDNEGEIRDSETNDTYYVHYSAIQSNDTFRELQKGQPVFYTLYTNLYMSQVDTVTVIFNNKELQDEAI